MLHEGKLAQEFGVSRTPVRQVLQRLSFEGLLETRSGVGTIPRPLDPANRELHFSILGDMLRLCASCCAGSFNLDARSRIATIAELVKDGGDGSAETYFYARSRILELVSAVVVDEIAADAHASMHWRVVRWRMRAARRSLTDSFHVLRETVQTLVLADKPSTLLRQLADEPVPAQDV